MDSRTSNSNLIGTKITQPRGHNCKMDDTYTYFSKKVDPVISPCVANFLFMQPQDIISALRLYFDHVRKGLGVHNFEGIDCYNPKKNQKIYFTYNFGPIISKLIDMIATSQPFDVVDYICIQLSDTVFLDLFGVSVNNDFGSEHDTKTKSTRNRLNDAITLANSIGNPVLNGAANGSSKIIVLKPEKEDTPVLVGSQKQTSNKDENKTSSTEKSKNIQITLLGMDGSGKTSIINALQGKFEHKMKPSLGFKPTTMVLGDDGCNIKFYDLGGGSKIRSIWVDYYHDIHAIIYVFDASLTGDELNQNILLFQSTMKHPSLSEKPILILANKQDKVGAISSLKLSELLDLKNIPKKNISFVECSSFVSKSGPAFPKDQNTDLPQTEQFEKKEDSTVDPKLEAGLELFLSIIQKDFVNLNQRVINDIEKRKLEDVQKRLERERKVLKNKIALAFKDQIEPSLLPENLPKSNPEDCFGEIDGKNSELFVCHFLIFYFVPSLDSFTLRSVFKLLSYHIFLVRIENKLRIVLQIFFLH